jgi:hypothetical protein
MSQLREDLGDQENNLDPNAALAGKVRLLPRKANSSGSIGDRVEQKPDLDTLDDQAEIVRERYQEVLSTDPDSPERDRALYQYNRDAEGYLHHATRVTKLAKKGVKGYEKLSTEQIFQVKEEYRAKLYLTVIESCLSDRPGKDEHYLNKVALYRMKDACREEAKGKKYKSKIFFLEQSGDAPILVDEFECASIIERTPDDRTGADARNSLTMLDLEQMSQELKMRSRPDISLFECFQLSLEGYSVMDIARYFARPDLTKKEFDRLYTNLNRFITDKKVFNLLKSYVGTFVITIVSFLMTDRFDF